MVQFAGPLRFAQSNARGKTAFAGDRKKKRERERERERTEDSQREGERQNERRRNVSKC